MLLSCNSQGVGFLFMAWLVSIIDINNTQAQTDSKLDAMTPSKTTLMCDPLHQEFTNVFCEIYCWCDITHPQCKGYESECICTNEIYLSHVVLIIYLILFNHYYTRGRMHVWIYMIYLYVLCGCFWRIYQVSFSPCAVQLWSLHAGQLLGNASSLSGKSG